MQSIDLVRRNLEQSEALVLLNVEDMKDHCLVFPTPNGGCHTLWVLGHLAYIETIVTRAVMLAEPNPLAHWEETFDGADVSGNAGDFPAFEVVLKTCREVRAGTRALLNSYVESDLDLESAAAPDGYEDIFGTRRRCLQFVADHWYMHRGQLADARRAAGLDRMWL
jgi:hypothetical protein